MVFFVDAYIIVYAIFYSFLFALHSQDRVIFVVGELTVRTNQKQATEGTKP